MRTFALYCAGVLLAFAVLERRGIDLFPQTHHAVVPASVRGTPGGYRVYRTTGGGGFRGGK